MTTLRLLNAAAVRELLPMEACIGLMRQAFTIVAAGRAVQPIRQAVHTPDRKGLVGWMPGYTDEPEWLGVKVVSVFPANFGSQLGSHQGMVLLFEARHGEPVAILDGREITAIRTAAATAAATDAIAPSSARTLGIFGYGEQARTHVEALRLVRPFAEVLVWGRDPQRAQSFASEMSARHGLDVTAVASAKEAAACDVICTTTAAAEPVLTVDMIRPGQHINLVGSSIPTTSEVDGLTIARGRVFVDFKASALALGGDLRRAVAQGVITEEHIAGCVGDVMLGTVPARRAESDITIFKSLGMVSEDIVASDFVLAEAIRHGAGQMVEW